MLWWSLLKNFFLGHQSMTTAFCPSLCFQNLLSWKSAGGSSRHLLPSTAPSIGVSLAFGVLSWLHSLSPATLTCPSDTITTDFKVRWHFMAVCAARYFFIKGSFTSEFSLERFFVCWAKEGLVKCTY